MRDYNSYRLLTKEELEDAKKLNEYSNKSWILDFTNNLMRGKTTRKQRLLLMKLYNKMSMDRNLRDTYSDG